MQGGFKIRLNYETSVGKYFHIYTNISLTFMVYFF